MKKQNDTDETFYPDKEKVEVKACLLHPAQKAVETFERADLRNKDFLGVLFGLCGACAPRMTDNKFRNVIEKEITSRLTKLKGEENVRDS